MKPAIADDLTLTCELTDLMTGRVIDRAGDSLSKPEILLMLGDDDLMVTIRDELQADSSRHLELTMVQDNSYGHSTSNGSTVYLPQSVPKNQTLDEASLTLAPFERQVSLRCFIQ